MKRQSGFTLIELMWI
ncbi:prepilin-type N-terminal cleavage/methylation domain-containing protein [Aeromonas caviae]